MKHIKSQAGMVPIIEIIILVGIIAVGVAAYYSARPAKVTNPAPIVVTKKSAQSTDPYAGWKTYTSTTEKATFRYPADWTLDNPTLGSNEPNVDGTGLKSPSGEIHLNWISALDGFGGTCDDQVALPKGCLLYSIFDKKSITGASGLYVIAGIATDSQTYQPWIAVQDDHGIVTTGRGMGYDMFAARLVKNSNTLLSTSGPYATGPKLSLANAQAWFDKPEAKQVKLIMASLSYQ